MRLKSSYLGSLSRVQNHRNAAAQSVIVKGSQGDAQSVGLRANSLLVHLTVRGRRVPLAQTMTRRFCRGKASYRAPQLGCYA